MALSVNKVQLIGYVGGDPATHVATSGTAITNFSLATGESWTDKNTGKRQERTEWHRVTCFGKIAEIIAQYAKKGSRIYVEGKNRTREWTDDQGIKRYTTEVVVDLSGQAIVLDPRGEGSDSVDARAQNQYASYMQNTPNDKAAPAGSAHPPEIDPSFDDDIPF
ncbi:single-stranded DNA-binding protein [Yersinia enterocolitica]|uniref:single-stranded DNA-binding protein n=1 Tax=Yersinia enterocolitica TaxID=630 RepID=UPI003D7B75FE